MAGVHGGRVVAAGRPAEIMNHPQSLTGAYLSGRKVIAVPKHRRSAAARSLTIKKASGHNLRSITVPFPIGVLTCVTGVSGSGKSTLVIDTQLRALNAKLHGSKHTAGSCQGDGILRIEMHFLPDVYVECEACGGRRYNRETLEVLYRNSSIADVLDMTVSQAAEYLENIPKVKQKLDTLREVGLGYVRLGQSATTLSGGEAQRIKLSKELAKKSTGRTVYILDEPTPGLHFADIAQLLAVLNRLVEAGNTVIVIEHNLDVIKTADWIIDL